MDGFSREAGRITGWRGRTIAGLKAWRAASLPHRLVRLDGGAAGAELLCLASGVLELRACVCVDELPGLDPLEAVMRKELRVRCFQQRPGNSAGPKVDVPSALGADRVLDRHIGDLDPPAGHEHAKELGEHCVFVGDQINDAVRDDDIEDPVWKRQLLRLGLDELDIRDAHLGGGRSSLGQHLRGHVNAGDVASLADHLRGDERVRAGARPQVKHPLARREATELPRVGDPGKGLDG